MTGYYFFGFKCHGIVHALFQDETYPLQDKILKQNGFQCFHAEHNK